MKSLFAFALSFALFAVGAAEAADKVVVKADTKEAFDTVAAEVRTEMGADGRYAYVKPDEREKVEASLAEMGRLFDANGSVDKMDKDTKVKLFNAQETVNSILTLRDRDRVICKKEAPVGSHIPVTTCHTYAQEVEARQGSKKLMDDWGRPLCAGSNPACAGK